MQVKTEERTEIHSTEIMVPVNRIFEARIGENSLLRFHHASVSSPYVVYNATPDHIQRDSQTVFPFGFLEFEGFDFQGMYDRTTIGIEDRIMQSTDEVTILSRDTLRVPEYLDNLAGLSLARMIQIAESTRTEAGLVTCQQLGQNYEYVHCLENISKTLPYGSEQITRGQLESPGWIDDTLTLVPLKGAALCVQQALPNVSEDKVLPISSTRVPLVGLVGREFGLGFTLPRQDFLTTVEKLIGGVQDRPLRLFEIAVVTGKTTMGFLALLRAYGVTPSSIEIMAPVVAQQGVEKVLEVSRALGLKSRLITYEMFYDLDQPNGNDSLRTADGKLVLGNPPRIAGQIAYNRVNDLIAGFIRSHNLNWL